MITTMQQTTIELMDDRVDFMAAAKRILLRRDTGRSRRGTGFFYGRCDLPEIRPGRHGALERCRRSNHLRNLPQDPIAGLGINFENQRGIPELDFIARGQGALKDTSPVAIGAIGRTQILEGELIVDVADMTVHARDEGIAYGDLRLGQAADN